MILPREKGQKKRMKNVCVCHCSAVKHCYERTHSIKTHTYKHTQSLVMTVYLCLYWKGQLDPCKSFILVETLPHTHTCHCQGLSVSSVIMWVCVAGHRTHSSGLLKKGKYLKEVLTKNNQSEHPSVSFRFQIDSLRWPR